RYKYCFVDIQGNSFYRFRIHICYDLFDRTVSTYGACRMLETGISYHKIGNHLNSLLLIAFKINKDGIPLLLIYNISSKGPLSTYKNQFILTIEQTSAIGSVLI